MLTAQTIGDLSPFALGLAVAIMMLAESFSPLVPLLPPRERVRHTLRNLGIAVFLASVAVVGNVLIMGLAAWGSSHRVGLLHQLDTPWPVRFGVALVGLDFFEWVRHRVHHRVPWLWRLHRAHHTDPHVDSSTALRGHPLESVVAYSWFSALVLLIGIDPLSLAVRSVLATFAVAWHHADLRVPERLDAAISLVTPTPRTHRLHHSRQVRFTDSNYGALFTWWDRLFGTFTPGNAQPPGRTGLEGFDSSKAQSVWGVLSSPLRNIKHDV